ncbi:hypothetical protein ACIBF5_17360 [Micromonospora sp. NPDC050417]|uniref:hypothetical protein n=1 Tax=Micromonospora sp. NPDC050417 TaxID=3364280 RepID=UPI00379A18F0
MTYHERFGPYRISDRMFLLVAVATVPSVGVLIAAFASLDDIHPAIRVTVGIAGAVLVTLALWAMRSSTSADEKQIRTTMLWRSRQILWSDIQDIRTEQIPGAQYSGMGASEQAVVYDRHGRRTALPYLDNRNVGRGGRSFAGEVRMLRDAWDRLREGDRPPIPATSAGRAELLGRLAEMSDPAELWRLVRDLPLIEAVTAVRRFEGWRPNGPDQALFDQLRRADPDVLRTTLDRLAPTVPVRLAFDEIVLTAALAPGERRLAVATMADVEAPNIVREYVLPTPVGAPADSPDPRLTYEIDGPWVTDLLHLGDAIVVRIEEFMGGTRLVRCADGVTEVFGRGVELGRLLHAREGFVGVAHDHALMFGSAHGATLRRVGLGPDLGLSEREINPWTLASEPGGGRLALGGRTLVVLDERAGTVIARATPPGRRTLVGQVVFAGPDRLVAQLGRPWRDVRGAICWDSLGSWRLRGKSLTYEGAAPEATWGSMWPAGIVSRQRVATVQHGPRPVDGGTLRFRDGGTLRRTGAPVNSLAALDRVTALTEGPDQRELVTTRRLRPELDRDDTVEVHSLRAGYADLITRPLGELGEADLAGAAESATAGASPAVRDLYALLDTCVRQRRRIDPIGDTGAGFRPTPPGRHG